MQVKDIFYIKDASGFNAAALEIFHLQAEKNDVYRNFIRQLNIDPKSVHKLRDIPFLPIEFFKTHKVAVKQSAGLSGRNDGIHHSADRTPAEKEKTGKKTGRPLRTDPSRVFESSGTTGTTTSKHYVPDISIYEESFTGCFESFYGGIEHYCLLALLPSYLENKNSSLIYMANRLIEKTGKKESGFYKDSGKLSKIIELLEERGQKTLLLGVSYALLDFAEKFPVKLKHAVIMETGGMKGRRREMIREELHRKLCDAFGVKSIHSEYGMTELLSQAYSQGNGIFHCPPWMKVFTRDTNDYFHLVDPGLTGGINIIDLANINSCSFIATQDLGKLYPDGSLEVLGRFDNSDIRGCNLMAG